MQIVIDSGNTECVFGLRKERQLVSHWRCRNVPARTPDEYGVWLSPLLAAKGVDFADIEAVIIASVVPKTLGHLRQLGFSYFRCPVHVVGGSFVPPMPIRLSQPSQLGADRLVAAWAAWLLYRRALILIDFGTATSFDLVSDDGAYEGGVISPGVRTAVEGLHRDTAQLPLIDVEESKDMIGYDTVSAMRSGIYWGYVSLIEGMVARLCRARGCDSLPVIVTGGFGALFARATSLIDRVEDSLMLEGLGALYELLEGDMPLDKLMPRDKKLDKKLAPKDKIARLSARPIAFDEHADNEHAGQKPSSRRHALRP